MKYCSECGTKLEEDALVCPNCNFKIRTKKDTFALTGFILGLVSTITWIIPLIGYPTVICSIIFSSIGLNSKAEKNKAIIGLILAIIFLMATIFNSALSLLISLESLYYY